jgi:hypothetical protein
LGGLGTFMGDTAMAGQRGNEKDRLWGQILREQRASGLSARAFCQQRGLAEPRFYFSRKKVARRSAEQARLSDGIEADRRASSRSSAFANRKLAPALKHRCLSPANRAVHRTLTLVWFPRLLDATPKQRAKWASSAAEKTFIGRRSMRISRSRACFNRRISCGRGSRRRR